ncbi:MAG: Coenzyme F420 hydrogenase/dehydrogenase, beta subunit C-terminal domain [Clostridia bacterium]|nr:Coenzyme F420 hydrogenase/dehydrogenase, beta subunit C-terminal domain [Clostridia bacterium]MBR4909998.1 Coenzyme F420 hydrogenase/dehydrogenase, beta subunit C-terminal domain [Clostridia bacterium]
MKKNVFVFKNHCCGCGICEAICPHNAIIMQNNIQGFKYPKVNNNKCVNCGLCVEHCHFNSSNSFDVTDNYPYVFALKHKSIDVRLNSRSGGAFTALTDVVLNKKGAIYGCELIDNRTAIHTRAVTQLERNNQRESKYIQSDISGVINSIKQDLLSGKYVLFSGTACQVAAIKSYLKNIDTNKLILVDIICHGVGSPRFWSDYLDYLSHKANSNVIGAVFRNKKDFGWNSHIETIYFNDKKYDLDLFKIMYTSHLIIRSDCSDCPYKRINRVGDITIGDCWGISDILPEFFDNKGVSLVIVNDKKGQNLFNEISCADSIAINNSSSLLQQSALNVNWKKPNKYSKFWRFYKKHGFEQSIKKYDEYAKSIMFSEEPLPLIKRGLNKCIKLLKKKTKK